MSVEKLERVLNLVACLLETRRPLTAEEIRDQVPGYPDDKVAFRRSFERDKDDLRSLGVPIELTAITHTDPPLSGYRIRKSHYAMRDPGLEPDELGALRLAASMVRLEGVVCDEALWKLGGALGAGATGLVDLPSDPNLGVLFAAIAARAAVSFSYRGEARSVEPWRLGFTHGRWYLTGMDRTRGAERSYRLDRIEGEVEAGAPGDVVAPADLAGRAEGIAQPWEYGDDEPTLARVAVDAAQAAWVVRRLGSDSVVVEHDDGSVEIELQVHDRAAFRSFVVSFLEHAEVLGPPELRASFEDWLVAIVGSAS